jgi:1-acyl-sn-glycerol-3-phosphate acyltransferase
MTKPASPYRFTVKFRLVRRFFLIVLSPFLRRINGKQNLRQQGPYVIAANHVSHLDWLLLQIHISKIIKKYIHFIATSKYFNNRIYRFLVEITQSIWRDENAPARALYIALQYLKHGEIVSIFPEGTRSPDGKIMKGKSGAAAFALLTKIPVIPVGLTNVHKILPRGAFIPRPARCEINIGKPLTFEAFYEEHDGAVNQHDLKKIAEIEEKVVRIIMQEIARLSNQEYPY